MTSITGTILIIGGAGYVGSNFIDYIYNNQPNLNIVNADNLTSLGSSADNINSTIRNDASRYSFIQCNMNDAKAMNALLNSRPDINYVLILAAYLPYQPTNQTYFIKNNLLSLIACLDILKPFCTSSQIEHILYQSSMISYINGNGMNDETPYQNLGYVLNSYDTTKTMASEIIFKYALEMPITSIYPSHIFGGINQHKQDVFWGVQLAIQAGQKVPLSIEWQTHNDLWVSVLDLIAIYIHILDEGSLGKKYRVVNPTQKFPLYDTVVDIIIQLTGTATPDNFIEFNTDPVSLPTDTDFTISPDIPISLIPSITVQSEINNMPFS